jgi:threonine dehydrogenase-like Zn-dependent dehydrogenase
LPQWAAKQEGLQYPRYIGHEVSGEVLEVGSGVEGIGPGDRVSVWVDGRGFAEQVVVRKERVFPIASHIPFVQALAEPVGCATNGVLKANPRLGDTVAVVGTGFMGLLLLQEVALFAPRRLIAIDLRDEMLDLARQLGADVVINPEKEDAVAVIKELTQGRGVDVALEAGGVQESLDLAAACCRMEGKLVIFGYHPGPRVIKDLGWWNWMAFEIINAHFRDLRTILDGTRIGVDLLNAGRVRMAPLITHTYPLEKIEEAFVAARDKPHGFVKAVVVME